MAEGPKDRPFCERWVLPLPTMPKADQKTPVKQKRLSGTERRQKIVEAARAVFMEQGYSGARTKEIADRAGVTEAFLYRHFESKDDMYAAAVLDPIREGIQSLLADVQKVYDEQTDPIKFVQALNERCLTFYMEFAPLQTVALYSELANGREFYAKSLRPTLDRIGKLIADRVGWADRGLDSVIVRRAVLGSQWAIGLDYMLRDKNVNVDEVGRRLTQMFTGGIKEKA
jgi:AcrR family transcriptional regulator